MKKGQDLKEGLQKRAAQPWLDDGSRVPDDADNSLHHIGAEFDSSSECSSFYSNDTKNFPDRGP